MEAKEILTQISNVLEKIGVKEALKKPEVIETIYNVMSKHGMTVDKGVFSLVLMGFANTSSDKLDLDALMKLGAGALGANALSNALGGATQTQQAQPQTAAAGASGMDALSAVAGLAAGMLSQKQGATQAQTQAPNAADVIGGIAKMLSQK